MRGARLHQAQKKQSKTTNNELAEGEDGGQYAIVRLHASVTTLAFYSLYVTVI